MPQQRDLPLRLPVGTDLATVTDPSEAQAMLEDFENSCITQGCQIKEITYPEMINRGTTDRPTLYISCSVPMNERSTKEEWTTFETSLLDGKIARLPDTTDGSTFFQTEIGGRPGHQRKYEIEWNDHNEMEACLITETPSMTG